MSQYLHIVPLEKADELIDSGVIDNTRVSPEDTFLGDRTEYVVEVDGVYNLVRSFMWDIDKIIESGYLKTSPMVDDVHVDKRFRHGKMLKFLPRYVHRYKVENFRALTFDVSEAVRSTILDLSMVDQDNGERIYFESASHLPAPMMNMTEIDIHDACRDILGMVPPYITHRFPEGYRDVYDRNLVSDSPIKVAPIGTIKR